MKAVDSTGKRGWLLVLMGSLGDVVRALPLVSIIKSSEPGSRITWLVERRWSELVALHPGIDRIVIFDRKRRLRGAFETVLELRKEQYDIVLDLQRHLKSGLASFLSGGRRRIGFHRANSKEGNFLFNTEHIGVEGREFPKIRHYLRFAEHLGLQLPERPEYGLSQVSLENTCPAHLGLLGKEYVCLVLGSSWRTKDWTEAGYAGLLKLLLSRYGGRVLLIGNGSEERMAHSLLQGAGSNRVFSLVGETSLRELVALLRGAHACVGPDSGPGHIAAAVGTPYVALFGPTRPERVAPHGFEALVVRSPVDCVGCGKRCCERREGYCMVAITPEMVWEKLQKVLYKGEAAV